MTKIAIVNKTVHCPRCGPVTMKYRQNQFFADEFDTMIDSSCDKILNYGACQLAASAKTHGHPIHSELQACPVISTLK